MLELQQLNATKLEMIKQNQQFYEELEIEYTG